jgi:uncharacterized membrane protein YccC
LSQTQQPNAGADRHASVLSAQKARQAATPGHMRYVLGLSLAMALAAGIIIWLAFFA